MVYHYNLHFLGGHELKVKYQSQNQNPGWSDSKGHALYLSGEQSLEGETGSNCASDVPSLLHFLACALCTVVACVMDQKTWTKLTRT